MYVRAGRPAFARSYAGVHRSTSLMSSSLLLQQCPAWTGGDGNTNPQKIGKETGRLGNKRTCEDHQNYSIIQIDQILRRLLQIWGNLLLFKLQRKTCEKRELKKLWNMKVTIILIVIGAFGTVTKGLLKGQEDMEIRGWVETIQTNTLLRTARILRRVLETWGDLVSLKLQWKTIS